MSYTLRISTTFTDTTNCCGAGVSCYLTMPTVLIDGTTAPYADLATATAAMSAQGPTGCFFEGASTSATRTVFTSSFVSHSLACESSLSSGFALGLSDSITSRVFLTAADGVSIAFSVSGTFNVNNNGGIYLYKDDETTLVSSSTSTNFTTYSGTFAPAIPADGYYRIYSVMNCSAGGAVTTDITYTATGGTSIKACALRAAYGATPNYLVCT